MIIGWELVGVCSFVLIGHWWEEKPNSDAALKAFLTNRVGDVGLLVGDDHPVLRAPAAPSTSSRSTSGQRRRDPATCCCSSRRCCLIAAVMSKSGQFILHTWLPDAMAGPTPVSALIHAATMVVAGIYMVARLYGVFFDGLSIGGSNINLLAVVGARHRSSFGALLAFVQNDIKKVLAYSTVSQLGYMVMALGVGAWTAALFHLFTHAFFKACLFLGAGSVSHAGAQLRHEEGHGRPAEVHAEDVLDVPDRHRRARRHLPAGRLLVEGRDPRRRQPARRRRQRLPRSCWSWASSAPC